MGFEGRCIKEGGIPSLFEREYCKFITSAFNMSTYNSSILITGGTQGLGYYCALTIARQCPSALIVLASRTDHENASASIREKIKQTNVKFMPLDLGKLDSVRDFGQRWNKEQCPPIQALILNAGIQYPGGIEYSDDGFEKTFAINHVGHSLLFHLLVPALLRDARIVVVSSGVHDPARKWGLVPAYTNPEQVAHPSEDAIKKSSGRDRYATSKVANVLWTAALGRHLASHSEHNNKTAISFDPGLMFPTRLARDASWLVQFVINHVAWRLIPILKVLFSPNINSPTESGDNLAWLALGKENEGLKGVYFEKRKVQPVSEQAQNKDLQEELWQWTLDTVGSSGEERKVFERLE